MPLTSCCAHEFLLDFLDARQGFRQCQLYLADRTLQPRQIRSIVDQFAVEHRGDFVNAVGKQEAAVEDRNLGVRQGTNEPLT